MSGELLHAVVAEEGDPGEAQEIKRSEKSPENPDSCGKQAATFCLTKR